ncbi:MAG: hypothetical protein RMI89_12245, partial [Gloeomargarita sp. SKYBB_i_bin120]|nr:hypothetical protein [Gloeomargarita sp. SKYB120]MDW8179282.1 hypothetical protein [Gloeomargarita sp. SKYBB_i_bin120]
MKHHLANLRKGLAHLTLFTATTALTSGLALAPSAYATRDYCSPLNGQWYFQGRPGPIVTEYG